MDDDAEVGAGGFESDDDGPRDARAAEDDAGGAGGGPQSFESDDEADGDEPGPGPAAARAAAADADNGSGGDNGGKSGGGDNGFESGDGGDAMDVDDGARRADGGFASDGEAGADGRNGGGGFESDGGDAEGGRDGSGFESGGDNADNGRAEGGFESGGDVRAEGGGGEADEKRGGYASDGGSRHSGASSPVNKYDSDAESRRSGKFSNASASPEHQWYVQSDDEAGPGGEDGEADDDERVSDREDDDAEMRDGPSAEPAATDRVLVRPDDEGEERSSFDLAAATAQLEAKDAALSPSAESQIRRFVAAGGDAAAVPRLLCGGVVGYAQMAAVLRGWLQDLCGEPEAAVDALQWDVVKREVVKNVDADRLDALTLRASEQRPAWLAPLLSTKRSRRLAIDLSHAPRRAAAGVASNGAADVWAHALREMAGNGDVAELVDAQCDVTRDVALLEMAVIDVISRATVASSKAETAPGAARRLAQDVGRICGDELGAYAHALGALEALESGASPSAARLYRRARQEVTLALVRSTATPPAAAAGAALEAWQARAALAQRIARAAARRAGGSAAACDAAAALSLALRRYLAAPRDPDAAAGARAAVDLAAGVEPHVLREADVLEALTLAIFVARPTDHALVDAACVIIARAATAEPHAYEAAALDDGFSSDDARKAEEAVTLAVVRRAAQLCADDVVLRAPRSRNTSADELQKIVTMGVPAAASGVLLWLRAVVADVLQYPQFAPMAVAICRASCTTKMATDVLREAAFDVLQGVVLLTATTSDVAEAKRSALSALVELAAHGSFAPRVAGFVAGEAKHLEAPLLRHFLVRLAVRAEPPFSGTFARAAGKLVGLAKQALRSLDVIPNTHDKAAVRRFARALSDDHAADVSGPDAAFCARLGASEHTPLAPPKATAATREPAPSKRPSDSFKLPPSKRKQPSENRQTDDDDDDNLFGDDDEDDDV
ncbi:hypothetical protein M885DRAFT_592174 [Pelagophyceae sp. CCMP2097]|nr:hypothetical protein M885DRAFT_592174 [Pelagophyceae sp. CCMP2097]